MCIRDSFIILFLSTEITCQICDKFCQQNKEATCFSDGWVYLNKTNSVSKKNKPLFLCSNLQNKENCSERCAKDVCILNCPSSGFSLSFFGFSFKCYSDGNLYSSSCEADCEGKDIFELFSCRNNTIDCRKTVSYTHLTLPTILLV